MNTNEHLDFYNPDSIYYANSHHYIQQLEAKVRQQQAEIEALKLQVKGYQTSTKYYRKKADGDDGWELTREYCS